MTYRIFFIVVFIYISSVCRAQSPVNKMLFIIDSIPLLNDPEEWNQILQDDIADINIIKNKDSLRLLGWEHLDGITYIFTKGYRKRPDSLKKIPGLKQMEMKNDAWHFHGIPYTGKYIDYYNNGKKQNEGTLLSGKLNGALIVYFKNGNTKLTAHYKQGLEHGRKNEYYKNGALMQSRNFLNGKDDRTGKIYFINGQVQHELRFKDRTGYDSSVTYYSNGTIKKLTLIKNGHPIVSKKDEELNYYTMQFNQGINTADLKEANRWFFKLWKIDSTGLETYFMGGLLFFKESRFVEAIAEFDKALKIEPLMREALVYRGLARLYKHTFSRTYNKTDTPLPANELALIPGDEQSKICDDLLQADDVDLTDIYVKQIVPETILNYCSKKKVR